MRRAAPVSKCRGGRGTYVALHVFAADLGNVAPELHAHLRRGIVHHAARGKRHAAGAPLALGAGAGATGAHVRQAVGRRHLARGAVPRGEPGTRVAGRGGAVIGAALGRIHAAHALHPNTGRAARGRVRTVAVRVRRAGVGGRVDPLVPRVHLAHRGPRSCAGAAGVGSRMPARVRPGAAARARRISRGHRRLRNRHLGVLRDGVVQGRRRACRRARLRLVHGQ